VRDDGNVAVDVHAEIDFDDVALGQLHLVLRQQRRVVPDAVVDGHARREGGALLHLLAALFLVVDLAHGLVDERVALVAQLDRLGARHRRLHHLRQHLVRDVARRAVLGHDVGGVEVVRGLLILLRIWLVVVDLDGADVVVVVGRLFRHAS